MHRAAIIPRLTALLLVCLLPLAAKAADISEFEGTYVGSAEFTFEGTLQRRDMSTTITPTKKGVTISWTSISYKTDGRAKEKAYSIEFVPSARANIFGSAMQINVFGKPEPLDPLKGEPFVWARLDGDTLTVFSLIINEAGGYQMQEYHRTLAEGGLDLMFRLVHNGEPQKEITTFLKRQ